MNQSKTLLFYKKNAIDMLPSNTDSRQLCADKGQIPQADDDEKQDDR
jgi:hypothetical protein